MRRAILIRAPAKRTASALLIFTLIASSFFIFGLNSAKAQDFASATQVPTGTRDLPVWPSISHDPLGRVWVAYANKTGGSTGNPDIFLKTFNTTTSTWSSPIRVTNDPFGENDAQPFVAPLSNGSMMIAWSSNRTGFNRYQLFYKLYSGTTVTPKATSNIIRLTNSNLNDSAPSAYQDRNGRIWVTWSRQNQTNLTFYGDIYYKYFNGSSWSSDFPLPGASNIIIGGLHQQELTPSLTQTKDGRMWVVWASNQTGDGTLDLSYTTTDGTLFTLPVSGIPTGSWSSSTSLCCSDTNADDEHPSIIQARNGTIMVFWDRCAGNLCLANIFFMSSTSNGASWSSKIALPAASTSMDERFPSAGQMLDKKVWVVWQAQGSMTTQLLYSTTAPIANIHDVGITGLTASPRLIRSGPQWVNTTAPGFTNVTVSVSDFGDFTESTILTVKLNATIIQTTSISNLLASQSRTIQFTYQTPGLTSFTSAPFGGGRYNITASLQPVPGESLILQGDNNWKGGVLRVIAPGDLVPEYGAAVSCVDIIDAATLAVAFSSTNSPPSPTWNPDADLNHDGAVNILDAALLATDYGYCF